MPDRRQGDRRESSNGIAGKKIEVSLGAFIFIVLYIITIVMLTLTCIVVAKNYYSKGYSIGYNTGIEDFKNGKIEYEPESGYGDVIDENLLTSEEYQNKQ